HRTPCRISAPLRRGSPCHRTPRAPRAPRGRADWSFPKPPGRPCRTSSRWSWESFFVSYYYISVPSAAGRLDDEDVAGAHLGLVERPELRQRSVGTLHEVAPREPGLAARHAVRPHQPVAR